MDAAAIAARVGLPLAPPRIRAGTPALAFDQPGGPLVAVCGLAGGAGASTLALLLGRQVAAASAMPVLLTEADPIRGGLAVLAGEATPHALPELAARLAEDDAPAETFLELEPGLRLIAATPGRCPAADPGAVTSLLEEARAAHGLVIVDCGTNWTATSPTLSAATHTLWCVPATPAGIARAAALFDSDVLPPPGRTAEALVASAPPTRQRVRVRTLRSLAARRCERLVLIPRSDSAAAAARTVNEPVLRALTGLAPTLRRLA